MRFFWTLLFAVSAYRSGAMSMDGFGFMDLAANRRTSRQIPVPGPPEEDRPPPPIDPDEVRRNNTVPEEELVENHKLCDPPCVEGRGVCNDNTCFCKHPYAGSTCQREVNTEARVSHTLAVGLFVFAVAIGLFAGFMVSKCVATTAADKDFGEMVVRRETWKPVESK
mmetsp:Transcript_42171/g.91909  ORF Transcript_42171/g.91909 Transcript_42171/m.91909 type:complete len:167 (+) Transcript_42171:145-645(+)